MTEKVPEPVEIMEVISIRWILAALILGGAIAAIVLLAPVWVQTTEGE